MLACSGPVTTVAPPAWISQLFLDSPLPKLLLDPETFRVVEVNGAALRRYGYSRDQFVALTIADLRPPEDSPALPRENRGRHPTGKGRHRTRDGALFFVETFAEELTVAGSPAILLTVFEARQEGGNEGARSLPASERRFRALIEHAHDMIATQAADRSISYVSPSVARVLGYTVDEYAGRHPEDLVHPDDAARMRATYAQVLRSPGVPIPARYRMRHKDGGWRWIHGVAKNLLDEPSVRAVVVNEQDDTERTEADEALRASERRFRTLTEGGPDAIGVMARGHAVYANPRLVSMLGFDIVAARTPAGEFIDAADRPEMMVRIARIMAGERFAPRVFTLVRGSGERLRAEVTSLPIEWEGEPALLSVFRDVTERERLDARLMLADRVASMGTLAAGVAHEINNPLAYVLANLAFSREKLEAHPMLAEVVEALREAQLGAERVRGIVRDLKTLSRPDESNTSVLDVHRALDISVSMAWNEIRHRARLVKDYALDLPRVIGNEGRLGQVFLNLLINAAHSIPEGSANSNEIRVVTRADAGRVVVEVRDTGTGIAAEHQRRLFDPFFTTKPQGLGTGLGLSICHTIVAALGGEIDFES